MIHYCLLVYVDINCKVKSPQNYEVRSKRARITFRRAPKNSQFVIQMKKILSILVVINQVNDIRIYGISCHMSFLDL